jgi:hypothetical protein
MRPRRKVSAVPTILTSLLLLATVGCDTRLPDELHQDQQPRDGPERHGSGPVSQTEPGGQTSPSGELRQDCYGQDCRLATSNGTPDAGRAEACTRDASPLPRDSRLPEFTGDGASSGVAETVNAWRDEQSPLGALSYVVTRVADGLDPEDMYIMADGLADLGYREVDFNTNVSTAEIIGYLESDINTLYHTGHGLHGTVFTCDGTLDLGDATVRARHVIFASCLTLDLDWSSDFGPTAKTIMGYSGLSFDYVDNEQARSFISFLGSGRSHFEAWFLSNIAISLLSDRWAAYVREGDTIIEYSARSGRHPASFVLPRFHLIWAETGHVYVAEGVLTDERTFGQAWARVVQEQHTRLASHVEPDGLRAHLSRPTARREQEALAVANDWLRQRGTLPPDAVLDRIVTIRARREGSCEPLTLGHVVRYVRQIGDLQVRSNLVEDHIAVVVAAAGVVAESRSWSDLTIATARATAAATLAIGRATLRAAQSLSSLFKGNSVYINDVIPVYGSKGLRGTPGQLVPAYLLRTRSGRTVVINALTGELLL